jgi:hypothetical protein
MDGQVAKRAVSCTSFAASFTYPSHRLHTPSKKSHDGSPAGGCKVGGTTEAATAVAATRIAQSRHERGPQHPDRCFFWLLLPAEAPNGGIFPSDVNQI